MIDLAQRTLTFTEIRFLQEALTADFKISDLRLREGEYQYDLAKAIASFQLELYFPDVKEIIKKLYGEEKSSDIQFVRKVQTILKKMEKSKVVKILPKNKPWELQRYALSSFIFQDTDKNLVTLATQEQINQTRVQLQSVLSEQGTLAAKPNKVKAKIGTLSFIVAASYGAIVWSLVESTINPLVFVPAFSVAVACSLMLGKTLSKNNL